VLIEVLNSLGAIDWSASVEKSVELGPGILLIFEIHEEGKSLFDTCRTSVGVQSSGKIGCCDVREAIFWSSWGSLEIKKWS